ncbi:PRC-barrel domain-containing protein [Tumebacillus sp. ITR2]|uniref:PRC-barrel domain-containing protein n=1 Tax=Tumebacillus amylolyticus TaxID=2801339 RepID=A0ABS1JAV1_9BACL|nr:PRC-barrel domain-containing protein [Tumebacillus amylolyticus]MBL0387371.1 PRC-barrel domain-containing protein [Tumebacillus amylolyticus]
MRKARDLLGLPVVDLELGENIGEVRDVLFSPEGTFHSFLLERGGLLSVARILSRGALHSIGEDAIITQSRSSIEEYRDEVGLIRSLIDGDIHFVGKDVLTTSGTLLGSVEDVYLDENLHTIVGYEISEGFLMDLRQGRKLLHASPTIMMGADNLIVPDDTELTEAL